MTMVPEGHLVRTFVPVAEPRVVRSEGGVLLAQLGLGSDDWSGEFDRVAQDVRSAISRSASPVRLADIRGFLADLFAPSNPAVAILSGVVVWVFHRGVWCRGSTHPSVCSACSERFTRSDHVKTRLPSRGRTSSMTMGLAPRRTASCWPRFTDRVGKSSRHSPDHGYALSRSNSIRETRTTKRVAQATRTTGPDCTGARTRSARTLGRYSTPGAATARFAPSCGPSASANCSSGLRTLPAKRLRGAI